MCMRCVVGTMIIVWDCVCVSCSQYDNDNDLHMTCGKRFEFTLRL